MLWGSIFSCVWYRVSPWRLLTVTRLSSEPSTRSPPAVHAPQDTRLLCFPMNFSFLFSQSL